MTPQDPQAERVKAPTADQIAEIERQLSSLDCFTVGEPASIERGIDFLHQTLRAAGPQEVMFEQIVTADLYLGELQEIANICAALLAIVRALRQEAG